MRRTRLLFSLSVGKGVFTSYFEAFEAFRHAFLYNTFLYHLEYTVAEYFFNQHSSNAKVPKCPDLNKVAIMNFRTLNSASPVHSPSEKSTLLKSSLRRTVMEHALPGSHAILKRRFFFVWLSCVKETSSMFPVRRRKEPSCP